MSEHGQKRIFAERFPYIADFLWQLELAIILWLIYFLLKCYSPIPL